MTDWIQAEALFRILATLGAVCLALALSAIGLMVFKPQEHHREDR